MPPIRPQTRGYNFKTPSDRSDWWLQICIITENVALTLQYVIQ